MKSSLLALTLVCLASSASAGDRWLVYFGCYTNAKTGSKGIHLSTFDSAKGTLSDAVVAADSMGPRP